MSKAGVRIQNSEFRMSRRTILGQIAAAAIAGNMGVADAQHVHEATAAATKATAGVYKPKALTPHEFATLRKLAEIIVPGATKGGCAEFVDILSAQNPEMLAIFSGGLAWMDEAMMKSGEKNFVAAAPEH
jgi:hypothetical protein